MRDIEFQVGERGSEVTLAVRRKFTHQFTRVITAVDIRHCKRGFVFDMEPHLFQQGQYRSAAVNPEREMFQKLGQQLLRVHLVYLEYFKSIKN
jgi:hypothetical protein